MIKVYPLSINFENQNLWIGKSVSRGFGTVEKQNTEVQKTDDRGHMADGQKLRS